MEGTKKWDEAESIQLIRSMLETTRYNFYSDRFLYFMWGYITLACALSHYILGYVIGYQQPYVVWLAMPVAGIVHVVYMVRKRRTAQVKTFTDRVMTGIWGGMTMAVIALLVGSPKLGWEAVYPFFMLLYGTASFASGKTLRFGFLVWGGIISIVCGILAFYQPFQFQLLLLQLAIIASYIVPAHFMVAKPE